MGLAKLAREAVGDGEDLVHFFTAVLRADEAGGPFGVR